MSNWPSPKQLLEELRKRNPERWGAVANISYTPGTSKTPPSIAELADEFERVMKDQADPVINLISRLEGAAFLKEDAARQQTDLKTGLKIPLTGAQKSAKQLAGLLREAADKLRELNSQVSPWNS